MKKLNAIRSVAADFLSVIHKAPLKTKKILETHADVAIFQTDLDFKLTNWNSTAKESYGQPGALGKNLFHIIDIDFINSNLDEVKHSLSAKGLWNGEILYKRYDGQQIYFQTTVSYIMDTTGKPVSVMFINYNINEEKNNEKQLGFTRRKNEILMNTLPQGVMMLNAEGVIEACNKRGADILGIAEHEVLGMQFANQCWRAVKVDGSNFPITEFPAIVSLQTGFPQRNVIMGFQQLDETLVWVSVNSEALIQPGEFEPYAVVITYTDITESKKIEEELRKSNERFYHISKVSTDAIWDIDFSTNQIYRSGAFRRLSGFTTEQIESNLAWWFNKIHPEDKERVKKKLEEQLQRKSERWDDEYRFECADGNYKILHDSGIILYKAGKPMRMLGAIRDLTEQKKLENQLLEEHAQRHKAITQATISAQEQEKTNISRELHDNVNQILMSGKLFMETAKRSPEQKCELLDKAIEYQLLALQEIRKLSKSLSTSNVKTVGLKVSIEDIARNMELTEGLKVEFIFNERVENKLTDDQKLMLFRIIQEQTSNIIKYAAAKTVHIMINEAKNLIHLVVSDDGKGFDTSDKGTKGIGFINIISRADAFNGKVNIISSKGNGCTLEICFPID